VTEDSIDANQSNDRMYSPLDLRIHLSVRK
jgi:hypothetical protein